MSLAYPRCSASPRLLFSFLFFYSFVTQNVPVFIVYANQHVHERVPRVVTSRVDLRNQCMLLFSSRRSLKTGIPHCFPVSALLLRPDAKHLHTRQVQRTCRLNSWVPDLLVKITTPPPGGGNKNSSNPPSPAFFLCTDFLF